MIRSDFLNTKNTSTSSDLQKRFILRSKEIATWKYSKFKNYQSHKIELFLSSFSKLENNMLLFILKKKILFLMRKLEDPNIKKGSNIIFFGLNCVGLPLKTKKIMLFRSPHVHKKVKDLFRLHKYKNLIKFKFLIRKGSKVNINKFENLLVKYLEFNMPKSVNVKLKIQKNILYLNKRNL